MNNLNNHPDLCSDCPNRSKLSRILGKIAGGEPSRAADCEGPVTVSHGKVQMLTQLATQPSPSKSAFKWHWMASGNETKTYGRTDWMTNKVCGHDDVAPRHDEVPYDVRYPDIKVNEDGSRHAAFISGSDEAINKIRSIQATMRLLDQVEALYPDRDANPAVVVKVDQDGNVSPVE